MKPAFDKITIDAIQSSLLAKKQIELSVLRLDKIDPLISGNKWFKLYYYIEDAIAKGYTKILTFGGAYSNHILATAATGNLQSLNTTGIIRGEEPVQPSQTLLKARQLGMELVFISREDYAEKRIPPHVDELNYYIIPEGGYGDPGARGAEMITRHFPVSDFTHICCAAGTGTMAAGLINGTTDPQQICAISVLKNNTGLEGSILNLVREKERKFELFHSYHFGGYAKYKPELLEFMNEWFQTTGIPSDFVYTGKLFFAIHHLVEIGHFHPGSRIMIIHSGGLQGNISLNNGSLIF
jgi:1-aminocyclopropane-1-carboxylate deaminase/D-cysteine desulfhydrase-like pyridoxal-dependent ACC family enzyme